MNAQDADESVCDQARVGLDCHRTSSRHLHTRYVGEIYTVFVSVIVVDVTTTLPHTLYPVLKSL